MWDVDPLALMVAASVVIAMLKPYRVPPVATFHVPPVRVPPLKLEIVPERVSVFDVTLTVPLLLNVTATVLLPPEELNVPWLINVPPPVPPEMVAPFCRFQ